MGGLLCAGGRKDEKERLLKSVTLNLGESSGSRELRPGNAHMQNILHSVCRVFPTLEPG